MSAPPDPREGPALAPPIGVQPDFDNPPDQNAAVHVMLAFCLTLTSVFLLLRIYTRTIFARQFQFLDLMVVAAFATYITYIWTTYRQLAAVGFFVRQWNLRLRDVFVFLFYGFIGISTYSFTIMLIKAAILLEWIRIFVPVGTRNSFYWICHTLLWINVLFYVAIIIAVNLACDPYQANWDKLLPSRCINTDHANMSSAIINFVFDLIIPILPQRAIWKLHMSTQKKLGVSVVFAIGFIACLTAGFRMGITIRALYVPYTTYSYSQLSLCCIAEMTCGFLVFCVPSSPKAFRALKAAKPLSSLKSWTGSSVDRMKGTRRTTGSSLPHSSLKPPSHSRRHDADERGLIALDRLGTSDSSQQQHNIFGQSPSQIAITRTTHFTATEEFTHDTRNETHNIHNQQHPWRQDGGPWGQHR